MARKKHHAERVRISVSRIMAQELFQIVERDGRTLAEFTRALWAEAIRHFRQRFLEKK
jgi:hypothetical protein